MDFKNEFLIFDGAMGTMLQEGILKAGELPELLNIKNPEAITEIHRQYVEAGADVITANTFGANAKKLQDMDVSVDEVVKAGISCAREAGARYVALDIGPSGALLKPLGNMTFDEVYEIFAEQVRAAADADCIIIETMSDLLEAKAALLAAKENSNLPVFVTMTFSEDRRTFLGTDAKTAAITLSALGADAVGVNCSLGPKELLPIVKEMCKYAPVPIIVQPNAGLPQIENGKTVFKTTPEEYVIYIEEMIKLGVGIIGGCCGTNPMHIKKVSELVKNRKPEIRNVKPYTAITSYQNTVILDGDIAVIGERINPTGKKKLKEALRTGNYDYIIGEAITQQEKGADILDVNAGLPEIDEVSVLKHLITEIQSVTPLPLQIDSSDPKAIETAVRVYNGKPIINSVNGKAESMEAIFPIVKKYGAAVVALTLDENGIPDKGEDRVKIAEKIINEAKKYGIGEEDILIDTLVLTASTNQENALENLAAIRLIKEKYNVKTVLGVSNISFGLPAREIINSVFLAMAFEAGLDMPILNPSSEKYMQVVSAYRVLAGMDKSAEDFILKYSETKEEKKEISTEYDLSDIIIKGKKSIAAEATKKALEGKNAFEIINEIFIPALDVVGDRFDRGEIFLPQLINSAEAVGAGFEVLREQSSEVSEDKGKILIATVKGDIHDIGKNIVKMLLENYGYKVVDLGKDVPPEEIVRSAKAENIKLVGLSALMTTTVKYMEETIKLLKDNGVDCKIMVGGAVLNEDYAKMVGADFYAHDAAAAAKIAARVFGE